MSAALIRAASPSGRWMVAASVLGSGAVFLESTVVNVALPALGRDFGLRLEGLQWVVNGYLLTLSALMLLGGALGDAYRRRRIFVLGALGFAATSVLAALAPTVEVLVAVRLVQGAAAALLVPNSLALLDTAFVEEDRGAAIGHWAGWSGISTALGPLVGGWLVEAASWRWVFAVVVPFALLAAWIASRRVADPPRGGRGAGAVDYPGAVLATAGLTGVVGALMSGTAVGFDRPVVLGAGVGGVALLAAFLLREHRTSSPLLPLSLFRSRAFSGANLVTLLVYAALGGVFFFLVLQLQNVLGYTPLAAGAALLPINVLLLLLSPSAGRLGQRIGPRWPMAAGTLLAAGGMLLLSRVQPGSGYRDTLLPATTVFGVGLAAAVAPLTAAVLGAVPDEFSGVASAVNNAAARLAGLLATAAMPLLVGLGGVEALTGPAFSAGFARAMWIGAGLCAAATVLTLLTVRGGAAVVVAPHPSPQQGCTQQRPARPGPGDTGKGEPSTARRETGS